MSFSINNLAAIFPSSGVDTAFGRDPQSRRRTSPGAWEAGSRYSLMSVLQSGLLFIYSIVFIKFQLVIQVSCPRGRSGRGKEMEEKQKRACEIHRCILCSAQGCKQASLGYPAQRTQFVCVYKHTCVCINTCVCVYKHMRVLSRP